jgi:hypothetical protein
LPPANFLKPGRWSGQGKRKQKTLKRRRTTMDCYTALCQVKTQLWAVLADLRATAGTHEVMAALDELDEDLAAILVLYKDALCGSAEEA